MSAHQLDIEAVIGAQHAFTGRTDTSAAAAADILPKTGTLRRRVYDYIEKSGGATDAEMQDALRMSGNTQRPRRKELEDAGLIEDSGFRRKHYAARTASIVWRLK